MPTRHATLLLVCVLACGRAAQPTPPATAPTTVAVVLAGPTVAAESLRVAATDSFGVGLAKHLAPGAKVSVFSDRDALDFIDAGGDVLVTDRVSVIRYASTHADFASVALPWDREYVFVSGSLPNIGDVTEAVPVDARPPARHCASDSVKRPMIRPIVYRAEDRIARSLAERIVGLGLAPRAVAVVIDTLANVSWMQHVSGFVAAHSIDDMVCSVDNVYVVPLIDTRSHLIVRRGAVGVVADTTGGVRLEIAP